VISWSDIQEAGVRESTKGASVEDHVRQLRRYKSEFVRDLAYAAVRLPAAWLTPGDATILALDPLALLDADQSIRFKELLDQCVHLVDLIEALINTFIGQQKATGSRFTKNDLESLRRGRGPRRGRDLLFLRCTAWPESVTAELAPDVAAVLWRCLRDRQSREAAASRDPRDLKALIQPLIPEVRRLVLEWTALKRLRREEADYVVSEVLDQLIRTVAERNGPPGNLAAWSHATARWKWRTARAGPANVMLPRAFGASGSDVDDEVSRRVDLDRRLRVIARLLDKRATWYATLTPPRPDDALTYRVAADIVGTRDAELIEAVVRELPEGKMVVRAALARRAGPLSAAREPTVIRVIKDMLRRHLDTET
jgi:hypothetical protein